MGCGCGNVNRVAVTSAQLAAERAAADAEQARSVSVQASTNAAIANAGSGAKQR